MRIGVLASHSGTNLQAIIDACKDGRLSAEVCAVVSNNSGSLALERLGWQPQNGFEDGLRTTVEWYLERQDWWQQIRDQTYAGDRLGLAAGA